MNMPNSHNSHNLWWGLGLEKEFPILIGPYKLSVYSNIITIFVQEFDSIFSVFSDDLIKAQIRSLILEFQNPHCFMLAPQSSEQIQSGDIDTLHQMKTGHCTATFFINYKHIHVNYLIIYNEEFLKYVSDKNFTHINADEHNKYREFIRYWNDFVLKLSTFNGVLPLFVGSRIIQKISQYALTLFPQIKHFFDAKKQPHKYKGFSNFIKWEFAVTFNPTLKHNKQEENYIDVENSCEYKRKLIKWGDSIFEQKILNLNYPRLDDDSGGYELRTFSKQGETFMNKTPAECCMDLEIQENELRTLLTQILSSWEIKNNVGIHFKFDFASYYSPILNFDYDPCAIVLDQIYSGETEINLTLPYLPHSQLSSANIHFLIPNGRVSEKNLLNSAHGKKEYEHSFKIRHIFVMKVLQLLSPLFLACFTGVVYFSFGDNAKIPETSKRFHSYANYRILTKQNLDSIYDKGHPHYSFQMNDHIAAILDESNIKPQLTNAYEFSVNRNDTKYAPDMHQYFGFEWKVLDQYPTKYVEHICLFIVFIAQWLHNNKIDSQIFDQTTSIPAVLSKQVPGIKKWLTKIIFQGWNAYVDADYISLVLQTLQFTDFPHVSTDTCYHFLNGIYSNLYRFFKTQKKENIWIISCFFPSFPNLDHEKFMNLPNINQMNYDKMMDDFQHYFPDIFWEYVAVVGESSLNEDFADMEFWENPD